MSEGIRRKCVVFIHRNAGYSGEPIELREEEANNWIAAGLAREVRWSDYLQSHDAAAINPAAMLA
jgi:hypothetical protein